MKYLQGIFLFLLCITVVNAFDFVSFLSIFAAGVVERAFDYLVDYVQTEFLEAVTDPEWWAKRVVEGAEWLEEKLDKDIEQSTPEEIVCTMLEDVLSEHPSPTTGDLNLYLRYAPRAGFYLLTWDRKEHVHTCKTWGLPFIYEEEKYYMEADYSIYRVIDGQEELVTVLQGAVRVASSNLQDKAKDKLKEEFGMDGNGMFLDGDLFFVDENADVARNPGQTLSYRVFATTAQNRPGCVDPYTEWESTVTADGNADMMPDFVPDSKVLGIRVVERLSAACPGVWSQYLALNDDLQAAFGDDKVQAKDHFLEYGIGEGRQACFAFNPHFYIQRYEDIEVNFGSDSFLNALDHWLDVGIDEGRDGSVAFNPSYYLNRHGDLYEVFGSGGFSSSLKHWLQHGITEGRDCSRAFSPKFYLQRYGDLAVAFGSDGYNAALIHWLRYGIDEGRIASASFDPTFYLGHYHDLMTAFGSDGYKTALMHWLEYGINEGRTGSEPFDPIYYLNRYEDLFAAFGSGEYSKALDHWVNTGIGEGRAGSEILSPADYLARYDDLRDVFGSDGYEAAIMHWLKFGKHEGRYGGP